MLDTKKSTLLRFNIKKRIKLYKVAALVIIIIIILPVYTTFTNSITDISEMKQTDTVSNNGVNVLSANSNDGNTNITLKPIPSSFTLRQYYTTLLESRRFITAFWKSFEFSAVITIGQVITGVLAAFAFSWFQFKGRDTMFFIIVATMMMPFQVTMVPNFLTLRKLDIINSDLAIILPGIFSGFGIFLMRQYMLSIPKSMIESAQVDGASTFSVFFRIILPMSMNGIAALITLSFIDSWNMIEQPLVFLNSFDKMPLSIIIRDALELGEKNVFAPSMIYMIPAIFIYFIFEDSLVDGIEKCWLKS